MADPVDQGLRLAALSPTLPAELAHPPQNFWALVVGSIGVVYGDIGTSPLYALKAALDHVKDTGALDSEVIGIVSLLIWALIFTVTVKYVFFLMFADNKGEGGTLSLMALAQKAMGRRAQAVFLLGVAGAALFSGDAIITPAISVLSAVEGLNIVSPELSKFILPITVCILIALFLFQTAGTERVARLLRSDHDRLLCRTRGSRPDSYCRFAADLFAINPLNGLSFLFGNGSAGFVTLGLVFLAVTGAEALYADMGHFGRAPIQLAWIMFILPALLLNYLGQGALILHDSAAAHDPFYLLAPPWALIPLVCLSTIATVIASQAVITGAFSLVRQAIQLGLLPRMEIQHTSETLEGRIYVPRVNRLMLIGVLILVMMFKTSDSLANAYGIAVTGTMVVTTALAFVVVWKLWNWPLWGSLLFVSFFLVIDLAFLAANLVKVLDGGWVPLLLGAFAMIIMWTWVRGTTLLAQKTHKDSIADPGSDTPARQEQADPGAGHRDFPDQRSRRRALRPDAQSQAQ